jgi:hypothetical protein
VDREIQRTAPQLETQRQERQQAADGSELYSSPWLILTWGPSGFPMDEMKIVIWEQTRDVQLSRVEAVLRHMAAQQPHDHHRLLRVAFWTRD